MLQVLGIVVVVVAAFVTVLVALTSVAASLPCIMHVLI